MTDTTDAPLSRTPARFFFETGYFAAYAEACIRNGHKPLFDLTDALIDRAWEIAPEAHPDRREFDRYLHRADSADDELRAGEAAYRAHVAADRETTGSREELATCVHNLRHFGAELFPTNRAGQAHFARVVMDTAATSIDAALAVIAGRPVVHIAWSDDGDNIRKWAREPFEGSQAFTAYGDADRFVAFVAKAAPNGEPIIVQYNPDGLGWSVYDRAKHPPRFFAETPTDDTRALVIAARMVTYGTIQCANPDDLRALDRALERYAATIAWDDEPQPVELPPLHASDAVVDQIAARMAKTDGLDWDEVCGYETDAEQCDSDTCVAVWFEDHDPDCARAQYRKYARAALGIAEPKPMDFLSAPTTQRFAAADEVSHNSGLIEEHTKRRITAVLGYDLDGGVQYRVALPSGEDRGLAYDCELDPWPGDDAALPIVSPRADGNSEGGK